MIAFLLAIVLQLQYPSPVGFVNDFAGVIDAATEQRMTEIWARSTALQDVRQTTRDVRRHLEHAGYPAPVARFCPGAAQTHSGDPLAIHPLRGHQARASGRARVQLTVL